MEGKIALTMEGMQFAMAQLAAGITAFEPVLCDELDPFRQMQPEQPDDETVEEEETMIEDDDGEDDEENDVEGLLEVEHQPSDNEGSCNETGDFALDTLAAIPVGPTHPILPANIGSATCCWTLPTEISQGRYNGRNGSNACSLISFLVAYALSKTTVEIPESPDQLPRDVIHVVCRCIELGNRVYEMCRNSLPSRYLSVHEASTVLQPWLHARVDDPLPVRLEDEHELTTVCGQLKQFISCFESGTALVIINEKTSLFYFEKPRIMYIDTHSHGGNGAVVMVANVQQVEEFCRVVWEFEGHDQRTFGNLVTVSFSTSRDFV